MTILSSGILHIDKRREGRKLPLFGHAVHARHLVYNSSLSLCCGHIREIFMSNRFKEVRPLI